MQDNYADQAAEEAAIDAYNCEHAVEVPKIIDKLVSFGQNPDGLFIRQSQVIPDEFLPALRKEREASLSTPAGDFHRVAAIPTGVVDKWKAEGFDVFRESASAILARLRKEQLDGFITTNRRV